MMRRLRPKLAGAVALCLAAGTADAAGAAPVPATPVSAAPLSAEAMVSTMARGINLALDDAQPADFATIHRAGFATVRLNLFALDHLGSDGRLDPAWIAALDAAVARASAAGLIVILDEHDFITCGTDAALCEKKLPLVWRDLARHFADTWPNVVFELLNEPYGQLTAQSWGHLMTRLLREVRIVDPDRLVVIGPANYNHYDALDTLALPTDDRRIIVTVHYFEPFAFTHQGAPWVPYSAGFSGITWGSPAERKAVVRDFNGLAKWATTHHRPLLLGEFGAYEVGAMSSRVAWTKAVAQAASSHGFATSYWQFAGSFAAYDRAKAQWIAPIRDAALGK